MVISITITNATYTIMPLSMTIKNATLCITRLNAMSCYSECKNADCHFAECNIFIVMLSVMLSVVNAQCRIFMS